MVAHNVRRFVIFSLKLKKRPKQTNAVTSVHSHTPSCRGGKSKMTALKNDSSKSKKAAWSKCTWLISYNGGNNDLIP